MWVTSEYGTRRPQGKAIAYPRNDENGRPGVGAAVLYAELLDRSGNANVARPHQSAVADLIFSAAIA